MRFALLISIPGLPFLLILILPPPAIADPPPLCQRHSLGLVACIADRTCECIYERGGAITGLPTGYRWDCSPLQRNCGRTFNPPVTVQEFRGQPPRFPAAVGIDRSTDSVTIESEASSVNTNTNRNVNIDGLVDEQAVPGEP